MEKAFTIKQEGPVSTSREILCSMKNDRGSNLVQILLAVFLNSLLCFSVVGAVSGEKPKIFIVYLGRNPHPTIDATQASHHNILSQVFQSKDRAVESLVYQYQHGFSGFSAKLTQSQADLLSQLPEVVSVFESKILTTQTTRSYSYLGLKPTTGIWPNSSFGADVIIGVIDSGIWPEAESFNDHGLSPIPARWKGTCVAGQQFDPNIHCNRKLIGARWFSKGFEAGNNTIEDNYYRSARDLSGHGTHCASIAAGRLVANASLFGLAAGNAVGGAPSARIAVYKVLWGPGGLGAEADVLAALDQAILDEVDILSISISDQRAEFFDSVMAIGSYHASERGILVSISGGNTGSQPFTVNKIAPWILTVAASTTDRRFKAEIELGDRTIIQGRALKNIDFKEEIFPIVDGASIPSANSSSNVSRFCEEGSLNAELVAGRIVLCQTNFLWPSTKPMDVYVKEAGGAGIILVGPWIQFGSNSGYAYTTLSRVFNSTIPAVGISERNAVDSYLSSCSFDSGCSPTAIIRRTRSILTGEWNPVTAAFSSRGPNYIAHEILKPDLTAPGVDIVAAWPESDDNLLLGPSGLTRQRSKFNLLSGTSMAAPHIAGLAAVLKATHPDWSPAAIKSALMTSASPLENGTVLDYGAGEINIERAKDPGLIYDLTPRDYQLFLCGRNYTNEQFEKITQEPRSICPNTTASGSLNYPSITFSLVTKESSVNRTVTNVGPTMSQYNVTIVQPRPDIVISVNPETLAFTRANEKSSFTVSVRIMSTHKVVDLENPPYPDLEHYQGSITWIDSSTGRRVTSPVSLWNYQV